MRGARLRNLALALIALGLAALALAPQWPGFWVCLSFAGWLLLLVYGTSKIRRDLSAVFQPPGRVGFFRALKVFLAVLFLAAAGFFGQWLPVINVAGPAQAGLDKQTVEILRDLEEPASLEAFVSNSAREGRAKRLLDLYGRASNLITTKVSRSDSKAMLDGDQLSLARSDTVVVTSGSFREVVSPVSQAAINASLRRLGSPNRLVLNLMGDGEKSALDESPMGLSLWAAHLEESKIYLKDSLFAGDNLPPEAWAAHALLLAGPRRPLGEEREKALMDYLSKGGKLIILQDPMVVGFRAASLSGLGIDMPWGLAVDPDATWAGTEDFFIVSRDFPAHPVTMGLVQPVVWPLAGALVATNPASGPASESGDLESGSDSLNAAEAQNLASSDKNSETPMNSASDASPDSGKIAASEKASASVEPNASVNPSASVNPTSAENAAALDQADSGDPPSHTWSVALSSDAAWLETDRISLSERNHRYQAKIDLPGPLTLASATTVAGGGRLVLAADADLASNAFIVYAGNMAFLDNALYWLMGAQEELYSSAPIHWLDLTYAKARILFWLPTVVWPVLALIVWLRRYLGRRRQTA